MATMPPAKRPRPINLIMVFMRIGAAPHVPRPSSEHRARLPGDVLAPPPRMQKANGTSAHARAENHPKPPFPPQHLEKPGLEADLNPKPQYEAPAYRPANKLSGKRALITGGDSGIGRAVA